jgi:hypothetical protein
MKKDQFSDAIRRAGLDDLQLLRDVPTRWSYTLLMIQRFLYLRPVSIAFTTQLAVLT